MPRARKAPKDWPAVPVSFTEIVSSRRPLCLKRLATSPDSMAPAERSTLRIGTSILTGSLALQRRLGQFDQLAVEHVVDRVLLALGPVRRLRRRVGLEEDAAEIEAPGLPMVDQLRASPEGRYAPMIWSIWVKPISASSSRTSSAT